MTHLTGDQVTIEPPLHQYTKNSDGTPMEAEDDASDDDDLDVPDFLK